MLRSSWKPISCDKQLLKVQLYKQMNIINIEPISPVQVRSRRSTILQIFINLKFGIYNGKKLLFCNIILERIGSKFGEYSFTKNRCLFIHLGNKFQLMITIYIWM